MCHTTCKLHGRCEGQVQVAAHCYAKAFGRHAMFINCLGSCTDVGTTHRLEKCMRGGCLCQRIHVKICQSQ
eukprot:9276804-Ditylum_brightwellii.AAC.1